MLFDELSNAACRVSRRSSGAELGGGDQISLPLVGRENPGAPKPQAQLGLSPKWKLLNVQTLTSEIMTSNLGDGRETVDPPPVSGDMTLVLRGLHNKIVRVYEV